MRVEVEEEGKVEEENDEEEREEGKIGVERERDELEEEGER